MQVSASLPPALAIALGLLLAAGTAAAQRTAADRSGINPDLYDYLQEDDLKHPGDARAEYTATAAHRSAPVPYREEEKFYQSDLATVEPVGAPSGHVCWVVRAPEEGAAERPHAVPAPTPAESSALLTEARRVTVRPQ